MTALTEDEEINFLTAEPDEPTPRKRKKASDEPAALAPNPPLRGIVHADPKKLGAAIDNISKKFGDGTIIAMTDKTIAPIDVVPTGSVGLDLALGVGGIPVGRVTEIFGPESSGKTTLCQHIIAEAQKLGGTCAYVDMEHALDPAYATRCGVDMSSLWLSQPDTGEDALEIVDTLVKSQQVAVIVVDSVATLVPKSEIDGEMGDAHMGKHARLMSQALRKLSPKLGVTALIFTNQLRKKIGVMFGNPETTTGGEALKFYASVRLDVRRIQSIKDGQDVTGSRARVRVIKNKVAPPYREAEFDIMFNEGISRVGDLLDTAERLEVVTKRGAFFSYQDTRIGQGRENAKQYLKDHPEMMVDIYANVMKQAKEMAASGISAAPVSEAPAED